MDEHKPVIDSAEVLQRISDWSREANWTDDELRQALRAGGVDPDRLVDRVMADVQRLLQMAGEQPGDADRDRVRAPRPLLVALRDHSQLAPSAIASAMDVPVAFLSVVSRHPHAVPNSWRQEMAGRAERALQVDRQTVLDSFDVPFQYDVAASRDAPYATGSVVDYSDLLQRAGMSAADRRYWQTLATDGA